MTDTALADEGGELLQETPADEVLLRRYLSGIRALIRLY